MSNPAIDSEKRLRILFVHNRYNQRGGEDEVVDSEVDLLLSRGHAVEIYSRSNKDLDLLSPFKAGAQTLWSMPTVREANGLAQRFCPDVVHVHNAFPLISPSVYWTFHRLGIPIVQTLHNFRLLCPQAMLLRKGEICEDCLGKVPWRGLVRRCYRDSYLQSAAASAMISVHRAIGTWHRKIDLFIALSQFSREKFIEGGLPEEKILVKPNFAQVPVAPEEFSARRGILFVGRLAPEKGVEILADAMRLLPNVALRVVGDGPLRYRFEGMQNVEIVGRLSREDVYREMGRASALVLPSICYENFPLTMLEAFACGLPVIASNLGSMAEILENGKTGYLVPPNSSSALARSISSAVSQPRVLAQIGKEARQTFQEKYSSEVAYAQLLAVYRLACHGMGDSKQA